MTTQLSVAAIGWYQRTLSPRKGWSCAFRVHRGGLSCSEWIKRAIARRGVRVGVLLAQRRFARCKAVHEAAKNPRLEDSKKQRRNSCVLDELPLECCCWSAELGGEVLAGADCAACACIPFV